MNILNTSFLNEPAYKWIIFFILVMVMLAAWKMILGYM